MPSRPEPHRIHEASDLRTRFDALWERSGHAAGAHRNSPWPVIEAGYASARRHYHGLGHLRWCLGVFDEHRTLALDADAAELALWFHDLVLEPGRRDNEARSAQAFAGLAEGWLAPARIAAVRGMILDTTHVAVPGSADGRLVCDVDLSSMGADWQQFLADSTDLWHEAGGDWSLHVEGKLAFFAALARRERLYHTDALRGRFEAAARANIQRMAELLAGGARL